MERFKDILVYLDPENAPQAALRRDAVWRESIRVHPTIQRKPISPRNPPKSIPRIKFTRARRRIAIITMTIEEDLSSTNVPPLL